MRCPSPPFRLAACFAAHLERPSAPPFQGYPPIRRLAPTPAVGSGDGRCEGDSESSWSLFDLAAAASRLPSASKAAYIYIYIYIYIWLKQGFIRGPSEPSKAPPSACSPCLYPWHLQLSYLLERRPQLGNAWPTLMLITCYCIFT